MKKTETEKKSEKADDLILDPRHELMSIEAYNCACMKYLGLVSE